MIAVGAAALATFARPDNAPAPTQVAKAAKQETCRDAVRAITYYRQAFRETREKRGLPGPVDRVWYAGCETLRRKASEWKEQAAVAREAYERWYNEQWDWRTWLPRGWYNIGSCETGYGGDPNWGHNSGTYQGAFGFAVSSWDSFAPRADQTYGPYPSEAYEATPRQQYEVALAIHRAYGLSGWGCRGAYYGR